MTDPLPIVVVGGGLAGIATAACLAEQGRPVTLLESRPRLGGRATSIIDRETGQQIDNCQHVSMGCCTNFQKLCQMTGTSELFDVEDTLHFIGTDGIVNELKNRVLPAPAHLALSFHKLSYLNSREKLSLAKALFAMMRTKKPSSPLLIDFLRQHRQSDRLLQLFWHVVIVSALSESLDRVSYQAARKVFLDGFLHHPEAWKIHLANVPLTCFYDEHLRPWLEARGVTIRLQSGVESILEQTHPDASTNVTGVKLKSGETVPAAGIVLAVPWNRVSELLPPALSRASPFDRVHEISEAPITSVHLWFERPITHLRHAVLVDRVSQWMFNRNAILGNRFTQNSAYAYQIVISNSALDISGKSQQQLIESVVQELREIWPKTASANLLHSRAITEHKAVFSMVPEIEALRPAQTTVIPNFWLAGDWTQTGWPATMEGAVRSGFLAATAISQWYGNHHSCLANDLSQNPLARFLIRS